MPVVGGLVEGEISVPSTHYLCHFINVPVVIDDLQANPTEVDEIDDFQANPPGSDAPFFRAHARVCAPGTDVSISDWLTIFATCTDLLNAVGFTFTDASGSSTQVQVDQSVQWDQVGIGDGQTVELAEAQPAGYTDPVVLCSSYPAEAGDAFDWNYQSVEVVDGTISVTPNLDGGQGPNGVIPEGIGYDCYFLHFAVEEIDDVTANSTEAPTEEPIDDEAGTVRVIALGDSRGDPVRTITPGQADRVGAAWRYLLSHAA